MKYLVICCSNIVIIVIIVIVIIIIVIVIPSGISTSVFSSLVSAGVDQVILLTMTNTGKVILATMVSELVEQTWSTAWFHRKVNITWYFPGITVEHDIWVQSEYFADNASSWINLQWGILRWQVNFSMVFDDNDVNNHPPPSLASNVLRRRSPSL